MSDFILSLLGASVGKYVSITYKISDHNTGFIMGRLNSILNNNVLVFDRWSNVSYSNDFDCDEDHYDEEDYRIPMWPYNYQFCETPLYLDLNVVTPISVVDESSRVPAKYPHYEVDKNGYYILDD